MLIQRVAAQVRKRKIRAKAEAREKVQEILRISRYARANIFILFTRPRSF